MNRIAAAALAVLLTTSLWAKDKDKDKQKDEPKTDPTVAVETSWEAGWAEASHDWAWSPGLKAAVDSEGLVPLSSDNGSGLLFAASARARWEPSDPSGAGPSLALRRFQSRTSVGWRQEFRGVEGALQWTVSGDAAGGVWTESLLDGGSDYVPPGADAPAFWTRVGPAAWASLSAGLKVPGWRWESAASAWMGLDLEQAYGSNGTDLLEAEAETTLTAKVLDLGSWEARWGSKTKYWYDAGRIEVVSRFREQALVDVDAKAFSLRLVPVSWEDGAWGWAAKAEIGPSERSMAWEASGPWSGQALTVGVSWKEKF